MISTKSNSNQYRTKLLLELEFFYKNAVVLWVLFSQILQMFLSVGNHREEAATRMDVFLVILQMRGQFLDSTGQNGDLNLRRACIGRMSCDLFDDFGFLCF